MHGLSSGIPDSKWVGFSLGQGWHKSLFQTAGLSVLFTKIYPAPGTNLGPNRHVNTYWMDKWIFPTLISRTAKFWGHSLTGLAEKCVVTSWWCLSSCSRGNYYTLVIISLQAIKSSFTSQGSERKAHKLGTLKFWVHVWEPGVPAVTMRVVPGKLGPRLHWASVACALCDPKKYHPSPLFAIICRGEMVAWRAFSAF